MITGPYMCCCFAGVLVCQMRFANENMNVLLFAVVRASRWRFATKTTNVLLFCIEDAFFLTRL